MTPEVYLTLGCVVIVLAVALFAIATTYALYKRAAIRRRYSKASLLHLKPNGREEGT